MMADPDLNREGKVSSSCQKHITFRTETIQQS